MTKTSSKVYFSTFLVFHSSTEFLLIKSKPYSISYNIHLHKNITFKQILTLQTFFFFRFETCVLRFVVSFLKVQSNIFSTSVHGTISFIFVFERYTSKTTDTIFIFFFWDFKHLSEILFRGNHFSFYLFKTFYAFMLPFPQLKQQLFVNCISHFLGYDKIYTFGS